MRRYLLVGAIAVSLVQAREVDSGLATVRQQLQEHPAVRRKLSGLHQRAALASGTLEETSAALERIEGPDASRELLYLRERLETAGRSVEADLASIGARLDGLGIPEKTAAWRGFVRGYRERMAEVDAELASLAAEAGSLSRERFRARLKALRAKFGGHGAGGIVESVKSSPRVEPAGSLQIEAAPRPADDAPGPADLASNQIVLLTAEIRAQAQALGGNAAALNAWVATHTEYVPYLGQMQNSLAVLWSHRGNDFDQATLLIALLRASGIPARYVCVDAVMPRADVREWMGLKDESIMVGLLSRGLEFWLFPSVDEQSVVATRVWVEAYLDTPDGKRWMTMDPARKRRSFQPGIVLPRPTYDRMAYLKAFQPVLPSQPYFDAMRAATQRQAPGRGFNEVPYLGTLLPPAPPSVDPPYPVAKLLFRSSAVPVALRHRINLSLTEYGKQSRYLSVDLSLPEIVLQSISLTYNPATAADRQVVQEFGGLERSPAAVVNLVPEFRMAGQVIASGKTPIPAGASMDLRVTHIPVAQGTTQYVSNNLHTAGETAAVVLGASQIGDDLVTSRISSLSGQASLGLRGRGRPPLAGCRRGSLSAPAGDGDAAPERLSASAVHSGDEC